MAILKGLNVDLVKYIRIIKDENGRKIAVLDADALSKLIRPLHGCIIQVEGKRYLATKPFIKTIAKDGETTIGGFKEVEE